MGGCIWYNVDMYIRPNTADKMTLTDVKRFADKFTISDNGCWEWKHPEQNGYGRFYLHGKTQAAHRVSFQLMNGYISKSLPMDHLCRNRACVNPKHLEQVTFLENMLRVPDHFIAKNIAKTHCVNGHEYNAANTYRYKRDRGCQVCRRGQVKAWYYRNKAKKLAEAH